MEWKPHKDFMGGTTKNIPDDAPQKFLRALDIQTGRVVWEVPQVGKAESWGGVLSTAGGVVVFCDDSGAFAVADARMGERLWQFQANRRWKASPMTYMFAARQHLALASRHSI